MNLQDLIAKLPASAQPLAQQYGPTILTMAAADIQAWLNFVFVGNYTAAYSLYLKSANADLLAEWDKVDAEWKQANETNAARIALSKQIAQAFAAALLPVFLAAAGF